MLFISSETCYIVFCFGSSSDAHAPHASGLGDDSHKERQGKKVHWVYYDFRLHDLCKLLVLVRRR